MRYFAPLVLLSAAGYVLWYNAQANGSALTLPFMDLIAPGDLIVQGYWSAGLLATVGSVSLINALRARTGRRE